LILYINEQDIKNLLIINIYISKFYLHINLYDSMCNSSKKSNITNIIIIMVYFDMFATRKYVSRQ